MKASELLTASSVDDLRELGSYLEIKRFLEEQVDNKLGVKGWKSLFDKIKYLEEIIQLHKEDLLFSYDEKPFKESRTEISKILKVKIKAKRWSDLKKKVDLFIIFFCTSVFDPYKHYERTKMKKFKDSSKLEGIDIEFGDEKNSLESVLTKYRR